MHVPFHSYAESEVVNVLHARVASNLYLLYIVIIKLQRVAHASFWRAPLKPSNAGEVISKTTLHVQVQQLLKSRSIGS